MDIRQVKELLASHGLRPNRALGQNFLVDGCAAEAIASYICTGLPVVEIGPGLGSLTEALIPLAPRVAAVEIDTAMAGILAERFGPELELHVEDFLRTDLAALLSSLGGSAAVAANLPYYVTTPISMQLMGYSHAIPKMALMMQREAAERFTAPPGHRVYGPLTVLAQYHYHIEQLMELSPSAYYPQPEVHSVVLGLTSKNVHCPGLGALLAHSFAMRRKTLWNNLKAAGYSADRLEQLYKSCDLSADIRAEKISPEVFASISREIHRI